MFYVCEGWGSSAAQTLKSVVAMYPDDLELYNELGQKYVINGAYEDARATFMQVSYSVPSDQPRSCEHLIFVCVRNISVSWFQCSNDIGRLQGR